MQAYYIHYINYVPSFLPLWSLCMPLFLHFLPPLSINKVHPSLCHPSTLPFLSYTSTLSFAWQDRLMLAILSSRSYMFATWQNWFSTPIVFRLLIQRTTSIWQPFIFHTSFLSLGDKQLGVSESLRCEASIWQVWLRGHVRARRAECTCAYVTHNTSMCVLEDGRWVDCQWHSVGQGKNLVVYVTPPASCGIVLIQRSLPSPPLGPINSSRQLREQLEHAMKLICLNVALSAHHFSHYWLENLRTQE